LLPFCQRGGRACRQPGSRWDVSCHQPRADDLLRRRPMSMLSSWIAGMDSAEVCETIYASRPICVKVSAQPACRASACMSVRWLHGQVLGCLQVNMCAAHTHEEGEYCRVLTVLCLRLCSQVVLQSCHPAMLLTARAMVPLCFLPVPGLLSG